MINCPHCGRENKDGAKLCAYCGQPVVDLAQERATRSLGETEFDEGSPKWGAASFHDEMVLILQEAYTGKTFVFYASDFEELIIGRQDPSTGIGPAIDLTECDALNKGVSRSHSRIFRRGGSLYIADGGSANGTFLNGQKLFHSQPRILRDGDDIRVGHIVLHVGFAER